MVTTILACQVREHLRRAWEIEERICSLIWGAQRAIGLLPTSTKKSSASDMFFLQTLLVTPNRFRPPNRMDDKVRPHPMMNLCRNDLPLAVGLAVGYFFEAFEMLTLLFLTVDSSTLCV